jgi:hypothetical protein
MHIDPVKASVLANIAENVGVANSAPAFPRCRFRPQARCLQASRVVISHRYMTGRPALPLSGPSLNALSQVHPTYRPAGKTTD